jgi:pyruvate ferredoxin oxidoreductase beta subunit
MKAKINKDKTYGNLFAAGHSGCAGCSEMIAARWVINALGKNTIVVNATGCLEVVSSKYPESSWGVPWVHSVFENIAPVASGIRAALKRQKKEGITVLAQGGDGAVFDIGFGYISGMWNRGDDVLLVCYDNEAYMNTGAQSSAATPINAATTTAPAGKVILGDRYEKKDMPQIAINHRVGYVATTAACFVDDIVAKVKKSKEFKGPKYIQIFCSCVPGWGIDSENSLEVLRMGVKSGLYPIFEYYDGKIQSKMKVQKERPKVSDYFKLQKRYKHLLKNKEVLEKIQEIANANVKKYELEA